MPTFELNLLIPLLAAHLISDFTLQTDYIAQRKQRLSILSLHTAITALCAYLLLGDFSEWRIPLLVAATHGFIDLVKSRFFNKKHFECPAFIVDQLAHLAVIFAIASFDWTRIGVFEPWWQNHNPASYLKLLLSITGLIAVTQASGLLIARVLPTLLDTSAIDLSSQTGFAKAGRYIGYLERLLLFVFVMTGQLAAAGFLIAAKSIFRFQKTDDDRRQSEYFLLGTLLSFTSGIAVSFAIKALIPH